MGEDVTARRPRSGWRFGCRGSMGRRRLGRGRAEGIKELVAEGVHPLERSGGTDEQPAAPITGPGASHKVVISIIARDPAVFRQIASWRWQDGLLPGPSAPLGSMDAFRNQFLDAFSTASSQAASAHRPVAPGTATVSGASGR